LRGSLPFVRFRLGAFPARLTFFPAVTAVVSHRHLAGQEPNLAAGQSQMPIATCPMAAVARRWAGLAESVEDQPAVRPAGDRVAPA